MAGFAIGPKGVFAGGGASVLTDKRAIAISAAKKRLAATDFSKTQIPLGGGKYINADAPNPGPGSGSGSGSGNEQPPQPPPQLDYSGKGFQYNVGCVSEAYFSPKASFNNLLYQGASGSVQDKPVTITTSSQLWSAAGKNKGMISLFIPPNPDTTMDAITPAEGSNLKPSQWEQYAFQFHYNPTSVSMTYSGTPAIDIALSASSGGDPFNLLGEQGSQSVIDFDLVLNRVADFKYYNTDGTIKSQYKNKGIYSPRMPKSIAEEKEIYNKGTMYDVEYLLSAVIGFKSDTSLRGTTADLGWLTGRPVKLSLGKSLKYVGTIDGFGVNHTMFDVRMVPIFSTVRISFKRIPDFTGLVE
jgi:hypothetical protein